MLRSGCALALVLVAGSVFVSAQTSGIPGALGTPDAPVQTDTPADVVLNPKLPTVFVVADSTARNKADLGWGDHFAALFDTSRINVANRAKAGRSARSYYDEGLWDATLALVKPGDYVLIQMGHNDGAGTPASVAADAKLRWDLKGVGEETVEVPIKKPFTVGPLVGKTVETVHTYGWYLRRYIEDVKAKGGHAILLTPTVRNIWTDGQVEKDMGYRGFEQQVAAQEHVPLADMAAVASAKWQAMGPTVMAGYFPIDHTHTSAAGAALNAGWVAESLRVVGSPLVGYLK